MQDYVIMTDSSCDLPAQLADELKLVVLPLTVHYDNKLLPNNLDGSSIGFSEFYRELRNGKTCTTSAVNVGQFLQAMEHLLEQGHDILYLGFSSGLSCTYSAGVGAAEQLREKYPERRIITVDTLCASLGQGLLIYLTVQQKNQGASLDEAAAYAENNKLHLCHWFSVDDLKFLRRGGRVSSTAALIGTALSIKPVMHMDNAGKLIPISKVRGRKHALNELVKKMAALAIDPANQTIFISHGDCEEDAQYLADLIQDKLHPTKIILNYVGPVIGSHSGPGTVALFFLGSER